MKSTKKTAILFTFLSIFMVLGGCVKTNKVVGYSFESKKLDKLVEGETRKAVVRRELGSPSVVSTYGGETWYYIFTEYETVAFFDPEILSQRVLAIKFNDNQTIKNIKEYDRSDAKEIDFASDKTKTEGHDVGILGQLLGNVGRFNDNKRDVAKPRTTQP